MRKILLGTCLLLTSLAHAQDWPSPSERAAIRAAAAPTLHLSTSEQTCSGPFVQLMAEWGGNATSYELRYNGVVLATSTGPSAKVFRPGASEFTLALKGCRSGTCKTISRVVRTMKCPIPPPSFEPDL